jgi:glutamate-5-semialdehyde dehydrogenase
MLEELLATGTAARAQAPPPGSAGCLTYCAELAARLGKHWPQVLAANAADVAAATQRGLPGSLIDRLTLTGRHLDQLVTLAAEVADVLPTVTAPAVCQPAGRPASPPGGQPEGNRPTIRRIPKPLGLILMIYEARPTVTIEGALVPVATGNAVLLRGGSEIAQTARAFAEIIADALRAAGLPAGLVQVITDPDRRLVRELLGRPDAIDALIPRGSPALIEHCQRTSTVPVIASGGGVNHLYVDRSADLELAAGIALDSKIYEPTACNTLEMVLAHADIAADLIAALTAQAMRTGEGVALRVDPALLDQALLDQARLAAAPAGPPAGQAGVTITPLAAHDDGREFLDQTLGVRQVSGAEQAIAHIRRHGSRHTEGVLAADPEVIAQFLRDVDAAALIVNSSLRLHDGPTMGLGPELSISTGRLHVRGPVGLAALLTYSWVIEGNGILRGGRRATS